MTDKEFLKSLDTSKPIVKINNKEVYMRVRYTRSELKRLKRDVKTVNGN